jgi:glycosyltransferase involved in cell wall biosynthesis
MTNKLLNILTVADLDWRNGLEFGLQALKILKDRETPFEYHLVGCGDFLEALAFARHELGLAQQVTLHLSFTASQLNYFFTSADLFLLPVVAPGGNHGLLQAAAYQIPVICTDLPGLAAPIVNVTSVNITPRRNPFALAECLNSSSNIRENVV